MPRPAVASCDGWRYSSGHSMPAASRVVVDVGDVAVALHTTDAPLAALLAHRFHRFLKPSGRPAFQFDITVVPELDAPGEDADADLAVRADGGRWHLQRGDFRASWDPEAGRGWIRQTRNPYAVDAVLRIVHTLLLSKARGFLLHASSAIRDGRAFLFTGPSGAGKTTIVRAAPPDVCVLTDEISYVRRTPDGYRAFGTPFAGEWADVGEPASAPVAGLFRLGRGADNTVTPLDGPTTVRTLMRNILFFADDPSLTAGLLDTACDVAASVPAYDLAFAPDARVWDIIR
jgi:hypothetical protein